jgi:phosphatidylinositol glycan class A protein
VESRPHPNLEFSNAMEGTKHRILMVSDFFFPNFGGVESHIYYLSQCLLKLGHKVVVMTHAYGNRSGVRYVTNGLKVYYVPWRPFLMQNTLPTLFLTLPIVRTIIIREKISVVHGHQALSTLCHEALMHARTMGLLLQILIRQYVSLIQAKRILS